MDRRRDPVADQVHHNLNAVERMMIYRGRSVLQCGVAVALAVFGVVLAKPADSVAAPSLTVVSPADGATFNFDDLRRGSGPLCQPVAGKACGYTVPIEVKADTTGCNSGVDNEGRVDIVGPIGWHGSWNIGTFSLPRHVVGVQQLVVGYVIGPGDLEWERLGPTLRFRWGVRLTCEFSPPGTPPAVVTRSNTLVQCDAEPRVAGSGTETSCDRQLRAVIRAPASVTRASLVRLDGSKSTPKNAIKSYRWTYALGGGCPGRADVADAAGSDNARTEFRALCSIRATLTVRDTHGHEDQNSTLVQVRPRRWLTPEHYEEKDNVLLRDIFTRPAPRSVVVWGENRCPNGQRNLALCRIGSWDDYYDLDPVKDGPFEGWLYVKATTVALDRVGFINPWMTENGYPAAPGEPSFYSYNMQWRADHPGDPCCDVATDLKASRLHEGYGTGLPASGHEQLFLGAIRGRKNHNDPRRYLEARLSSTKKETALRADIAKCLDRLDAAIYLYGLDNLQPPLVQLTSVFAWSPAIGQYVLQEWGPDPPLTPRQLTYPGCADP
jgi:hypothetical protein